MASPQRSYSSNAPGDFFVDDTCIDCDLCRQIAPRVFSEESDHSIVFRQPESDGEKHRAAMSLVACPTGSIGSRRKIDLHDAVQSFPEQIEDNVYFCGFASSNSYGASSYLIVRPQGNVLVDSPRFAAQLVRRIEALGGVALMYFTHRDDIADHDKFHRHFGCRRIIHRADAGAIDAEHVLEGNEQIQLADDLLVIPTPGHTRGHAVLLYRDRFLFTGDHLAWSDNRHGLVAFRDVNWYSWPEQTKSMKRLLGYKFEWVLPGHGRRVNLPADVMRQKLQECVDWMASVR